MAQSLPFPEAEYGAPERRLATLNAAKFTFVFAVFNLHQLSKSFAPLYGLLLLAATAMLGLDLLKTRIRLSRDGAIGLVLVGLYLMAAMATYIHSLALISPIGATIGLVRFLFAFPVFLAAFAYIHTVEDLEKSLVSTTVVVAVLYLSIPWQIAFGQLSWLPSDYERGGFERYASLLGNVTAVGIAVGFYLAPALFLVRDTRLRLFLVVALLISSAASLSKAAIMNVALVPLIGLAQGFIPQLRVWQNWSRSDVFKVGAVFVVSIAVALAIPSVRDRLLVNLASYGVESAEKADDVSIDQSIGERIFQHPKEIIDNLYKQYHEVGWITGAGFGMSSTALVPEKDQLSIMAHNEYFEFLGIGGIFYVLLFIIIISYSIYKILFHTLYSKNTVHRHVFATLIVIFINYVVNLPFANGLVYQPLQAATFWVLIYSSLVFTGHEKDDAV